MGSDDEPRHLLQRLATWLGASPSELAGLVVLVTGALAVAGVVWWAGAGGGAAEVSGGSAGDAVAQPSASGVLGEDGTVADPSDATSTPGASDTGGASTGAGGGPLVVDVGGAVRRPGVVRLPSGARVADAVVAAGGTLPDAADVLNLARPLTDGERVVVPTEEEVAAGLVTPDAPDGGSTAAAGTTGGQAAGGGGAVGADGILDLNLATVADLDELPGVGPVIAQRIVDWREANGPFADVAQLREVSGIGDRRFEDLAPHVTVR